LTAVVPRSVRHGTLLCIALTLAAPGANAQTLRITESLGITETYTTNVNFTPSNAKSDWVSEITPKVTIDYKGAHSSLTGFLAAPILLYARTGSENNTVYAQGDLLGTWEAIDKFFFVEAEASASQQYFNPFGTTPVGLTNASNNRYTSYSYRVSPYVQGVTNSNISYLLRFNAVWGNLSSTPISASNSYYTEWVAHLQSPVAPWGWAADFDRTDVNFTDQSPQTTQIERARTMYQFNPQLQLSASVGYEQNHFPFSDYNDFIYGVQATYKPTERTNAVAGWEHRFFGASYLFTLDHRMPLSVYSVNVFRNTTTYTQQLASLPGGANVPALLNDIFSTRIPDPTQRQTAVNQLIANQGLPQTLGGPVNLYTQQIILQESASVAVGLLGANNSVFLNAFYLRQEPISGSGNPLPPILAFGNNNTQRGVGLSWSHPVSTASTFVASASANRTTSNSGPSITTNDFWVRAGVNWNVSPYTSVQFGGRYQLQRSDFQGNANEVAVFAGFVYQFH
jgi:uncharacterized protein (PEP-CTERM system associated)